MKLKQVTFLLTMVLGTVLAPVVEAQAPTKAARIGWMSRAGPTAKDANMDAFRQRMRELGYIEGRTFVMEPRYAEGKNELMPDQAAELERSGVDVIIAGPFEALHAAKQSTSRVPIIMTPSVDPVATGVLKNSSRPEGNITGITEMMPELTPQRLRLLKQIVPTLTRVAILWSPGTLTEDTFKKMLNETQDTAFAMAWTFKSFRQQRSVTSTLPFPPWQRSVRMGSSCLSIRCSSFSGNTSLISRRSTSCRPSTSGSLLSRVEV